MLEDVFRVADRRLLIDELSQLKLRQHLLQLLIWCSHYLPQQRDWKLPPNNRDGLQQLLLRRRQPVDPRSEHSLNRRRHLYLAQRLCEPDAAVAREHALFEQSLDYLLNEEWIALASFDDQAAHLGQGAVIAQQHRQHLLGPFLAQWIQPQLRVVSLPAPVMAKFGPITDKQEDFRRAHRVG